MKLPISACCCSAGGLESGLRPVFFVDNRQAFHFKQVFRCAALGGITGDTVCEHCENGTINGPDGKRPLKRATAA